MFFLTLPIAWIEDLAPLLLVVFWVIRQIMSVTGGEVEQEEEEENPRRKPLTPEQKAQKQSVEQFLQEIGAVPKDPRDLEPAEAKPMAAEVAIQKEGAAAQLIDPFEEPQRRKPQRREPPREQLARPVAQPSVPSARVSQRNKEQRQPSKRRPAVESHLAEKASHLGEQIGQTDERIEARLHDKFDHKLGKLNHREETPAEQKSSKQVSQAARILELLSSPGGVRDAVVLNEILKPPVDHWD